MTAFVICNNIQIVFSQYQGTFRTDENPVQSIIKAVLCHHIQIAPCCQESCFVDEISDVRANHPRSGTRNRNQIYVLCQWYVARVNLKNCQAAIPVGTLYRYTPVKAAWAQERLVQPIGTVCLSNDDNRLARIKAIHFHQQLVQGLLTLVVAIDAGPALATYGIDLINEDDAGRRLLGLVEEVTHTARANSDQHFDEFRAAHREERHARFAGNGTRKQRLTSSRRSDQQHSTGNLSTQALELMRRLQKFDHLNKISFIFINACYIGKRHARPIFYHHFGPPLPKAKD